MIKIKDCRCVTIGRSPPRKRPPGSFASPASPFQMHTGSISARILAVRSTGKSAGRVEAANYRTVRIPTDTEIPVMIKGRFGETHKTNFL